jgi:hypothetical protein
MKQPLEWLRYTPKAVLGKVLNPLGIGLDELWLGSCLRKCRQFKPGEFDAVLATGSPFSTFIAAKRVATRLAIPYVLDYRDPWSLNTLHRVPLAPFIRPIERRLLREASATLMVSPSECKAQTVSFQLERPPIVLTNGYAPDELGGIVPASFTHFAVVYAGTFYKGSIEIDPVLKAVQVAARLRTGGGTDVRLHYYGDDIRHVMERAMAFGAGDVVVCHGHVPRAQALAAIKGAGAVAVIAGIRERDDLANRGHVPGKIFEPLGMGMPVLLVAPEGSDATAIVDGAGAGRSFRASQTEAMAAWILEVAREPAKARYEPPNEYSWPVLATRLDEVLTRAIHTRRGP